ncbi:MAG: hypothetical protein ACI9ST_001074 [Psychrobacter glaciei]|jgi:hypothetical protein|uniref:hypothetical protein n=1 Tax=Psychrobacter glaciei TaxID=619771 RepID=UPI0039E5D1A1
MPLTHTGINKLQPSPTAIDTNDLINTVTVTGCNYGCVIRALCVDKLGWHEKQYILPDRAIGSDDKQGLLMAWVNDPKECTEPRTIR